MRFRDDILRGVRLFAIVFAAILIALWIYRTVHAQSDVLGASPDLPASPETAQPLDQKMDQKAEPHPAPVAEAAAEPHGLMVPPPPPVAGAPAPRIPRQGIAAKPAPIRAVASSNVAPAPPASDFETSHPIALPGEPAPSPELAPAPPKNTVGYKSLVELNSNRVAVVHTVPLPAGQSTEQPTQGNRFFKAVGKIFHGGKKETLPLTLHQP